MNTKTFEQLLITPEEARDRLRPIFLSREFWILAFDSSALPVLKEIRRRFYAARPVKDFHAGVFWGRIGILVARKKYMPASAYARLLGEMILGFDLTPAEMAKRDVASICEVENGNLADLLLARLLDAEGLAVAA